ncbi:MAG: FG-GAP-like repeat-containing protein [Wenzhouxiangellaceae bacterium]
MRIKYSYGLVVIAAAFSSSVQAQSSFSFSPYQLEATNGSPEAVAIGDVTGDGLDDVVVINNAYTTQVWRNHVLLYQQQNDGQLAAPVALAYTQSASDHRSLQLVNLDTDDAQEIAIGHSQGLTLVDFTESGLVISAEVASSRANHVLESIDLNNDGFDDLIGLDISQYATVYLADGEGGIAMQYELQTANAAGNNDLEVGDLNNDGLPDLAVMNGGSSLFSDLAIHEQDGFAGFLPAQNYSVAGAFETPSAMAVADFNGDGLDDVVLGRNAPSANFFWVFSQAPGGQLSAAVTMASAASTRVAEAADLDGNGLADLVLLHRNSSGSSLGYLLQDANGLTSEQLVSLPAPSQYELEALALGDINSDGCGDAVVADINRGMVILTGQNCLQQADLAVEIAARSGRAMVRGRHLSGDAAGMVTVRVYFSSRGPLNVNLPANCTPVAVAQTSYEMDCDLGAMVAGDVQRLNFWPSDVFGGTVTITATISSEIDDPNPGNNFDRAELKR